jgi:hypothetical protein
MPIITSGTVIEQNDVFFYAVRINNNLLGTGDLDYGYGQALINSNVPIGFPVVKADTLTVTAGAVETLLRHQGVGNFGSIIARTGDVIRAQPSLATNYQLAIDNRLNAHATGTPVYGYVGSTQSFNSTQTMTSTASFGSHAQARYFFNAGGQFNISLSHPNGPMQTIAANMGSIRFGAGNQRIAGVNYTGTTKLGGDGNSSIITGRNFYNTSSSDEFLIFQYLPGTTAEIRVLVRYNGAGALTFTIISYAPNTNPTTPAGSLAQITAVQPPTTYIANSWGPITFFNEITQTSVSTEASELSIMVDWLNERGNYIRGGLFQTYYAGDYAVWNNPHVRYGDAIYEIFTYDTAGTVSAAAMENKSKYFTAITTMTGGIGYGRPPPETYPQDRDGNYKFPITSYGEVWTADGGQTPDNSGYYGLGFNVQAFEAKLSTIASTIVTTYQGGGNNGSWNYQLLIPGKWGVVRRDADFTGYRTLPPGRLGIVLYERGGNGNGSQLPVAPFTIRYDAWWYNGGGIQICANNTGADQTIDFTQFNQGYTPRIYLELSHPT